jgi:hypothetical protein
VDKFLFDVYIFLESFMKTLLISLVASLAILIGMPNYSQATHVVRGVGFVHNGFGFRSAAFFGGGYCPTVAAFGYPVAYPAIAATIAYAPPVLSYAVVQPAPVVTQTYAAPVAQTYAAPVAVAPVCTVAAVAPVCPAYGFGVSSYGFGVPAYGFGGYGVGFNNFGFRSGFGFGFNNFGFRNGFGVGAVPFRSFLGTGVGVNVGRVGVHVGRF